MGSKSRSSTPTDSTKRLRRKACNSNGRLHKGEDQRHRTSATHIGGAASVSDKLEALKGLIPSESPEIRPEQLFQETADYIVLLKTQVFVLQKLIDFYGSQPQEYGNSV